MKYALVVHRQKKGGVNIGDYIQCLAARQFLPKTDLYVERDELNLPTEVPVKVIMNGWFTYHPENWPPHENLIPLFVSFHLNPFYANTLLNKKENIEYLRKFAPIGCRDYSTLNLMKQYEIDAYYSFCLTSTLDIKYKSMKYRSDKIIFSDVMYKLQKKSDFDIKILDKNILRKVRRLLAETIKSSVRKYKMYKLIPKNIYDSGVHLTQEYPAGKTSKEYFDIAESLLLQYANAKLVVTSRIHCAIPCLALGTPVLFIPDGISFKNTELSRLKGTIEHLNILTSKSVKKIEKEFEGKLNIFSPKAVNWVIPPENPKTYLNFAEILKEKCFNFTR